MNKRTIVALLISLALASVHPTEAQQAGKIYRIGVLFFGSRNQPHLESFLRGLRELGYVEGKNIVFEYRYAEGKSDRLHELAAELVRLKVDVIVTTTSGSANAAQQVTETIPIILTTGDPVGTGLAASLARPGGNVTGLSVLLPELSGKRLELLKETLPKITRVAVLWNPTDAALLMPALKEIEVAAQAYTLQLHSIEVRSTEDIDTAFVGMKKARLNALLTILDPLTTLHSKRIVELAAKNRLPGMYPTRQFVEEGGLMAYGINIGDLYHRAATYVDKVLKGAKPADLPVEQPTKFEFIINLKTAKQIGVTIPPNVLARADKVIK
jgi:putative tryptophan/tyrosine transport system substrate-binding protein